MRAKLGIFELAASQFLKAIRGRRSQRSFARRLGYSANPITDWENGRRYPTAEEALRAASAMGVDVSTAFRTFHSTEPPSISKGTFVIAPWLDHVRGDMSLLDLAQRARVSRFSVGRWCRGQAKPRLPDFFRFVDAATGRLQDLVALLVPIANVPTLLRRYHAAQAARTVAYDAPWSEAIMRVLSSTAYTELPEHRAGYIASFLGITEAEERRSLALLRRAGAIYKEKHRYRVLDATSVDTKGDHNRVTALIEHWSTVARDRVSNRRRGHEYYAYNVCSLSSADFSRVREVLARAFGEIRSIVAASTPEQRVALVNLQVIDLASSRAGSGT